MQMLCIFNKVIWFNPWQAGAGQYGTNESVFNAVLSTRSYNQLYATFERYREISGQDIEDSIKSETSGTLQEGLLAIG